ncbi:hypothetical protein C0V72_09195 [Porphyrobacter sp. TH134]|uniref:hypothetical protein n=1 Tax=Porphyrobacter sp. TH134 TaxID=2067450 RepID=UPI000C7D993A|nr:hypothetical protein [Porphyrobacter sp. TH134]PLK23559.1 hypothetical protein C0V72_09195 [Porphyrobacter sp. TH134]
MTKPDLADHDDGPSANAVNTRRALLGTLAGIALLFLAGVFAGFLSGAIEQGTVRPLDVVILAGIAGLMAVVAYSVWRFWPGSSGEPVAQSARKATRIIYAMCGIGAIMGFALGAADDTGSMAFLSNRPVSNVVAGLSIAVWAVVVPALTWMWWRTVDEHETAVYAESGLAAVHVYLIGVPTWWMATRAGWLPAQDPMIVWVIIAVLWSAIWLYRRYT